MEEVSNELAVQQVANGLNRNDNFPALLQHSTGLIMPVTVTMLETCGIAWHHQSRYTALSDWITIGHGHKIQNKTNVKFQ